MVKAERLDPLLFCHFVTINIMSLKTKLTVANRHFQLISLYTIPAGINVSCITIIQ